jgi:hypothetical protein
VILRPASSHLNLPEACPYQDRVRVIAVFAGLSAQPWFAAAGLAPEIGQQKTLEFDMSRVHVSGH